MVHYRNTRIAGSAISSRRSYLIENLDNVLSLVGRLLVRVLIQNHKPRLLLRRVDINPRFACRLLLGQDLSNFTRAGGFGQANGVVLDAQAFLQFFWFHFRFSMR